MHQGTADTNPSHFLALYHGHDFYSIFHELLKVLFVFRQCLRSAGTGSRLQMLVATFLCPYALTDFAHLKMYFQSPTHMLISNFFIAGLNERDPVHKIRHTITVL